MGRMAWQLEDDYTDVLRKAAYGGGIETDELAAKAGIARERLEEIMGGQRPPSEEEAHALASVLRLGPKAFWGHVQGWHPGAIDLSPHRAEVVRFPAMNSNGYVIGAADGSGALLVDPGGEPERLIEACRRAGGLAGIALTHTHFDHVEALPGMLQVYPQAPVLVHQAGRTRLRTEAEVLPVAGEGRFRLGSFELEVWPAPGHSRDGLAIRLNRLVFVGDTLFAGSLGRSEQGPLTYATLLQSARRLLRLPPETLLLPGHGPATTVALESVHNPFLAV